MILVNNGIDPHQYDKNLCNFNPLKRSCKKTGCVSFRQHPVEPSGFSYKISLAGINEQHYYGREVTMENKMGLTKLTNRKSG